MGSKPEVWADWVEELATAAQGAFSTLAVVSEAIAKTY